MITRNSSFLAVVIVASLADSPPPARGQYSRETPITAAVRKTRDSVLSLQVERRDSKGKIQPSYGAAFIVDERGYAVTNAHVVSGASRVQAYLTDGTCIKVRVLFEESAEDVALLKLETVARLKPVILGSSRDLMVGETVLAVGNALGLSHTVSRGIVSGLGRRLSMPRYEKISERGLIQTDAAINAGNSGGPLLNVNGEVIGMNFAVRHDGHGVAFAIPVDAVKGILCRHLSASRVGSVQHELICIESVAEEDDSDRIHVEVRQAASNRFRPGDRLMRIAGRPVHNRFDVERAFWDCKPGDVVEVSLRRAGGTVTLQFTPTASRQELAQEDK